MLATSQQSGSSANGARFGRRWLSRSSPVSGSVVTEMTVWLIGPKLRTKLLYAMRSRTCASTHG
jgi:hypothetical protein